MTMVVKGQFSNSGHENVGHSPAELGSFSQACAPLARPYGHLRGMTTLPRPALV